MKPGEQLKLVVMEGPSRGEEFKLDRDDIGIGRDPKNHIVLDGTGISHFHARIVISGKNVSITDLGSLEGVIVNGKKTDTAAISPGSRVQIGNVRLRVDVDRAKKEAPSRKPAGKKSGKRRAKAVPLSPSLIIALLFAVLCILALVNMHWVRSIISW